MRETHIILRSPRVPTRGPFLGAKASPAGGDPTAAVMVEVEDIDRRNIAALERHEDVVAVAPSMPMRLIAPVGAEETAAPAAQGVAWGVTAVGADTSPFTGEGIVVAVLDTGIDASHPAFAGVTLDQKDFTGDGNGDQHGHGTHCAGTTFGRTTDGQRIGVAPGVEKALIGKVLGSTGGPSEQVVSAVLWAMENGANVISMSLGIDFPGFVKILIQRGLPPELATSRALEGYRANIRLFEQLASLVRARAQFGQATVIVAAAGNESQRDVRPDFEIAVSPPAIADGIVSVAAVGESSQGFVVANFSNTGANVAGPGVKITSAKRGGGLTLMNGTSMATPHVAGVAALWAQKLKSGGILGTLQLTTRLMGSASFNGMAAGFDPFDVGLGMVRAPQS